MIQKPKQGARINWSNPLSRGLLLAYPINEGPGSRLLNSAAYPLSLPLYNGATVNGRELICTTTNSGAYATIPAWMYATLPLTLVIRFKPVVAGSYHYGGIAANTDWSAPYIILALQRAGDTYSNVETNSAGTYLNRGNYGPDSAADVNKYVSLLGSTSATRQQLFFSDGWDYTPTGTFSAPTGNSATARFCLGRTNFGYTENPNFKIECAYFWNRELTKAEFLQLHENPYAPFNSSAKLFNIPLFGTLQTSSTNNLAGNTNSPVATSAGQIAQKLRVLASISSPVATSNGQLLKGKVVNTNTNSPVATSAGAIAQKLRVNTNTASPVATSTSQIKQKLRVSATVASPVAVSAGAIKVLGNSNNVNAATQSPLAVSAGQIRQTLKVHAAISDPVDISAGLIRQVTANHVIAATLAPLAVSNGRITAGLSDLAYYRRYLLDL